MPISESRKRNSIRSSRIGFIAVNWEVSRIYGPAVSVSGSRNYFCDPSIKLCDFKRSGLYGRTNRTRDRLRARVRHNHKTWNASAKASLIAPMHHLPMYFRLTRSGTKIILHLSPPRRNVMCI